MRNSAIIITVNFVIGIVTLQIANVVLFHM